MVVKDFQDSLAGTSQTQYVSQNLFIQRNLHIYYLRSLGVILLSDLGQPAIKTTTFEDFCENATMFYKDPA